LATTLSMAAYPVANDARHGVKKIRRHAIAQEQEALNHTGLLN